MYFFFCFSLSFLFSSLIEQPTPAQPISSHRQVLVGLYEEPEKPANALDFVQQHLTSKAAGTSDVEALKAENASLKARIEEVRKRVVV